MKIFHSALLALALISAPIDMVVAQLGSQTFPASGSMNGQQYVAITFNFDAGTITYHFANGSQMTFQPSDPNLFWAAYDFYAQREIEG